ncbi:hypothetical protein ABZ397_29645 [Streptomyces sp. NPDC005876]|uniref:hypothetical protein n=1 Tax=Streptomyces sp. NPDC005876 TaxID=3157076 RepID=UPI0033D03DC9
MSRSTSEQQRVDLAQGLDERLCAAAYRHASGPIPLRPALLPRQVAVEMRDVSVRLMRLVRQVSSTLARDIFELADLVGYRRPDVCMLTDDAAWNTSTFQMARPDVVLSGGVVRVVECNVGSALAGPEQVTRIDRYFREVYGAANPYADISRLWIPEVMPLRREVVLEVARQRGVRQPSVAVLGWDRGTEFGSAHYFDDVVRDFQRSGVACEFAVPNDLVADPDALTHEGRRIDVALRMFLSADAHKADLDMSPLRDAMQADTAITLSPDAADVYSSKKLLAYVSEAADDLPSGDREFVRRHLPWTRLLTDSKVFFEGEHQGLVDLLIRERERFFIKPSDQHGGQGITAGVDTDPDTWEEAVERALRDGTHIAQEFFRPDPLAVPCYRKAGEPVDVVQAAPVFGPMLMGGELGGVLVRHTDNQHTAVVNAIGGGVMNTCWITQ